MSSSDTRSYGHFCVLAKAMERIGDRWALLVVRDLRLGPKRFTDLIDRLDGITPKTLTRRLRDLEDDGIVAVDREPGRREVWYRLTPAGEDLEPALDELMLWGLRNLAEPPRPDEPVHPEHLLVALQLDLEREGVDVGSARWAFRVPGTGDYLLTSTAGQWTLQPDDEPGGADVTVTATRQALARFLTVPAHRTTNGEGIEVTGNESSIRTFLDALKVFPPRRS